MSQGDEVGGSNTAVCTQKVRCRAWELDWNVDIRVFAEELKNIVEIYFWGKLIASQPDSDLPPYDLQN